MSLEINISDNRLILFDPYFCIYWVFLSILQLTFYKVMISFQLHPTWEIFFTQHSGSGVLHYLFELVLHFYAKGIQLTSASSSSISELESDSSDIHWEGWCRLWLSDPFQDLDLLAMANWSIKIKIKSYKICCL